MLAGPDGAGRAAHMIIDAIAPPKQLLYFSPVAWDSYAQRPHYFVRHFLRPWRRPRALGRPVPEPPPRARPTCGGATPRRTAAELDPRVTVIRVPAWPVEPLPGGAALNRAVRWRGVLARLDSEMAGGDSIIGVGRPSALALLALERYPRARALLRRDGRLPGVLRRALPALDAAAGGRGGGRGRSRVRVVGCADGEVRAHAACRPRWSPTPTRCGPCRRTCRASPGRPRSSATSGTVGRWFDWGVVASASPRRSPPPRCASWVPSIPARPAALPANVRFAGECPQPAAVEHLRAFACGLIPFRQSPLTAAVDPIKYYEYRGMGLPVLSTRFGQMAARGTADGVFMVGRAGGRRGAPRAPPSPTGPDAAAVARFRAENDWETRLRTRRAVSRTRGRCLYNRRAMKLAAGTNAELRAFHIGGYWRGANDMVRQMMLGLRSTGRHGRRVLHRRPSGGPRHRRPDLRPRDVRPGLAAAGRPSRSRSRAPRPHLVVCNAGGLSFRPDGRAAPARDDAASSASPSATPTSSSPRRATSRPTSTSS